jgi:hypothetical protein
MIKNTDHTTRQTINQAISTQKGMRHVLFAYIGSLLLRSLGVIGMTMMTASIVSSSKVRAEQIEGTEVMIS